VVASIPTSDDEVFSKYFSHIKWLVSKRGISRDNVEDISMVLMTKFVEKNVLGDYNPDRKSDYVDPNGYHRTANFKTFLSGFVNSYLRHFSERDRVEAYRSSLSTDMRWGENSDIPLLDYLGVSVTDMTDAVEAEELIGHVMQYLKTVPGKDITLFFEFVILQVREHGKMDAKELAEMFEVTTATIYNWLKKLREAFEVCM